MGTEAKDGAAVRVPPPLPYVVAVAGGIGLQFIWPLPIGVARGPRVALGVLVALLSVPLVVGASRLFRKTGQDPRPWLATPEIIRSGVYRFTRNPMYLSLALLQSAIGIVVGNLWIVLLVPLACAVVYLTAIRHEEVYLERKFGDSYLDYKKSVRRWL
jgi:protein-S-isoprenylcysteine O-methyltransferase Ste14